MESISTKPAIGKLKSLATAVGYFYLLTVFTLATPYYNWQYAHDSGFVSWILGNEIVPTCKASVWPVIAYLDYRAERNKADEMKAIRAYVIKMQQPKDVARGKLEKVVTGELAAKVTDQKATQKQRLKAYYAMCEATNVIQDEYVAAITPIKPPDPVKELHEAILAEARGSAELMKQIEARAAKMDKEGTSRANSDAMKFEKDSFAKIELAAQKAHVKDWEVIVLNAPDVK